LELKDFGSIHLEISSGLMNSVHFPVHMTLKVGFGIDCEQHFTFK
jgi:hypothetical protein